MYICTAKVFLVRLTSEFEDPEHISFELQGKVYDDNDQQLVTDSCSFSMVFGFFRRTTVFQLFNGDSSQINVSWTI